MAFDIDMIKAVYQQIAERVDAAREVLNKPMTLSEKILYGHLWQGKATEEYKRGKDYVEFAPDRVAMQDATAQMALLQFTSKRRSTKTTRSTTSWRLSLTSMASVSGSQEQVLSTKWY